MPGAGRGDPQVTRRACLLALALCAAACAGKPESAAPVARPNIVFILTEDLSPRLGAYGDRVARTPRIDALAKGGVRFTRAFTTAGVCAPSRTALVTGVYAWSLGGQHMRTSRGWDVPGVGRSFAYLAVPPPEVKAFPELLRRAGYYTLNQRKTDFAFGDPFTLWDVYDPAEFDPAPWRRAPRGQPFFAMVNPVITHESMIWPQPGRVLVTDPNAVTVPPFLPDTPVVRRDLAQHYDNAATLDSQVGQVLDALEADGLADRTIVIFSGDHGDGLPHAKRCLYDTGLHVPLVVRFPDGRGAGTVRDDLVSFVDLAPTILRLAGLEPPAFVRGQPLFGDAPPRAFVFAGSDRIDKVGGRWRSVRDARFEYLANFMPERPFFEHGAYNDRMPTMQELWRLHEAHALTPLQESQFTTPRPAEELYDLAADPDQTRNLAADPAHAGDLARLRAALADFAAHTPDLASESERAMAERMWPGLVQPVTGSPVPTRVSGRDGPAVALASPTPGASIGYRLSDDPPSQWRLYVEPVPLRAGISLEAKAVRYGWAESPVAYFPPRSSESGPPPFVAR